MSRHPDVELSLYAAGALAGDERAHVERHLADCAACRRVLAEERTILERLAATAPAPPEVGWPRYRAELRARREAAVAVSRWRWRGRWWARPLPLAASAAVVAAAAMVLFALTPGAPPAPDLAAIEYEGLAERMELIHHYPVVERLDMLEDLDVIRDLDQLTSTRDG